MKLIFKAFVSLSMQSAYTDTDAAKILHRATVLVLTSFSLSLSYLLLSKAFTTTQTTYV